MIECTCKCGARLKVKFLPKNEYKEYQELSRFLNAHSVCRESLDSATENPQPATDNCAEGGAA